MYRRTLLQGAAAGTLVAASGCLTEAFEDEGGPTALDPPADGPPEGADLSYPTHGEPFPDVTLPDPIAGTTVDTADIDDVFVCTAIYASCPSECLMMVSSLAEVQRETIREGIDDEVTFLAITFDPERDTAEVLEDHARLNRVDLEAGNWHYLRPEDAAEAKAVVEERLGVAFQRDGGDAGDAADEGAYDFTHLTLTFLVNPEGYVERAYTGDFTPVRGPSVEEVFEDVVAVRSAFE
ncbi:SCO family protein [Salinilacihabitans rarus]|uniref:SCO family protein n=1 Tax=Salinilacihabitans rarus TaxID=2961596 RepID=UPI0020C8F312|nr:SCO family protein [Salinilacihabitans rarus]